MRHAALVLFALALAPTPLSARTAAFDGAFDLNGTEPFWDLQIRPDALKYMRADEPDRVASRPTTRTLSPFNSREVAMTEPVLPVAPKTTYMTPPGLAACTHAASIYKL